MPESTKSTMTRGSAEMGLPRRRLSAIVLAMLMLVEISATVYSGVPEDRAQLEKALAYSEDGDFANTMATLDPLLSQSEVDLDVFTEASVLKIKCLKALRRPESDIYDTLCRLVRRNPEWRLDVQSFGPRISELEQKARKECVVTESGKRGSLSPWIIAGGIAAGIGLYFLFRDDGGDEAASVGPFPDPPMVGVRISF